MFYLAHFLLRPSSACRRRAMRLTNCILFRVAALQRQGSGPHSCRRAWLVLSSLLGLSVQAALSALPSDDLQALLKYICTCNPASLGLGAPGGPALSNAASSSDGMVGAVDTMSTPRHTCHDYARIPLAVMHRFCAPLPTWSPERGLGPLCAHLCAVAITSGT